jgi:hypothetical protein
VGQAAKGSWHEGRQCRRGSAVWAGARRAARRGGTIWASILHRLQLTHLGHRPCSLPGCIGVPQFENNCPQQDRKSCVVVVAPPVHRSRQTRSATL